MILFSKDEQKPDVMIGRITFIGLLSTLGYSLLAPEGADVEPFRNGGTDTTRIGYVNRNNQRCEGQTWRCGH